MASGGKELLASLEEGEHLTRLYSTLLDWNQVVPDFLKLEGSNFLSAAIESAFQAADKHGNFVVKSISILRNVRNFSRYQATKARLRADPPLRDEQEAAYLRPFAERTPLAWGDTILFHGTSDKGVTSINEIGFSKHYSHTGLLGKGLYFSPYIQKCDVYASKLLPPSVVAPSGEIKVIIVCAVVLGRIYDNKQGWVNGGGFAGPHTNEAPSGFHSVRDYRSVADEYVVYDEGQVLPIAAVYYSDRPDTAWPDRKGFTSGLSQATLNTLQQSQTILNQPASSAMAAPSGSNSGTPNPFMVPPFPLAPQLPIMGFPFAPTFGNPGVAPSMTHPIAANINNGIIVPNHQALNPFNVGVPQSGPSQAAMLNLSNNGFGTNTGAQPFPAFQFAPINPSTSAGPLPFAPPSVANTAFGFGNAPATGSLQAFPSNGFVAPPPGFGGAQASQGPSTQPTVPTFGFNPPMQSNAPGAPRLPPVKSLLPPPRTAPRGASLSSSQNANNSIVRVTENGRRWAEMMGSIDHQMQLEISRAKGRNFVMSPDYFCIPMADPKFYPPLLPTDTASRWDKANDRPVVKFPLSAYLEHTIRLCGKGDQIDELVDPALMELLRNLDSAEGFFQAKKSKLMEKAKKDISERAYAEVTDAQKVDLKDALKDECTICLDTLVDEEEQGKSQVGSGSTSSAPSMNTRARSSKGKGKTKVDDVVPVKMKSCTHMYHKNCIDQWIKNQPSCPLCKRGFPGPPEPGPMPDGWMGYKFNKELGAYFISYDIRATRVHPGTERHAIIPMSEKHGNLILIRLIAAFYYHHTFRVGTSLTTGRDRSVVWNGIHHRTSLVGTYGYPDLDWENRVGEELDDKGVLVFLTEMVGRDI